MRTEDMINVNLDGEDNAYITVWPTLFKQTTTGKIQQWKVKVFGNGVISEFGQTDGKLQETRDVIKSGKNLGKSNETTPEEQAKLKAQQLFDKKVKEGYVQDMTLAQANKNNLEGVEPMLAFDADKKEKYLTFPAYAQPKLDGFRCITVVENGKATMYTRTQKVINTLPHIVQEIENIFGNTDIILDGELYNHELKDEFEKIQSYIKRDELHPDREIIQYHLYDVVVGNKDHHQRFSIIRNALESLIHPPISLKLVETTKVCEQNDIDMLFKYWLGEGYEGAMYRSLRMPYENKRSAGLLKIKVFEDHEFEIVGVNEGTGKDMGSASTFTVKNHLEKVEDKSKDRYMANGYREEFKANIIRKRKAGISKPQKESDYAETKEEYQARREEILNNPEKYIGKQVTVQYQGRSRYGVPRFPQAWRMKEEL